MNDAETTQDVTLSYHLTPPDLRSTARLWRKRHRLRLSVILVIPVVVGFLASSITGNGAYFVVACFASLCLYALLRFGQWRVFRIAARRMGDVTVTFNSEGVAAQSAHARTESSWSAYGGFVENNEVFLLYDEARFAQLRIYPKRAFSSPSDLDRLRRLCQEHIAQKG